MNKLQVFYNEEFGNIRVLEKDGQLWLIGKDVATALGYTNPRDAIARHVDVEDKGVADYDTPGGKQELTVISESGMYALIFGSKMQGAKRFKHWVTSEVLPSIRKNGGYIANQEQMTPEQIVASALIVAQNIINEKDKLLADMKPKAEFFDTVANSKTALPMDRVAKVLDMGIGRNKLFKILREKKVLDRGNIPYQEFVDRGYFRVVEQKYTKPNGDTVVTTKTLVYQRGIDYIRKIVA